MVIALTIVASLFASCASFIMAFLYKRTSEANKIANDNKTKIAVMEEKVGRVETLENTLGELRSERAREMAWMEKTKEEHWKMKGAIEVLCSIISAEVKVEEVKDDEQAS